MKIFTSISSGIYKGKKLELPSLSTTRSTKSIVKGSFFDTFRFELSELVFIEGFGGSGVMTAEAFSNGAKGGIAIEKDKTAFVMTKRNLESISQNLKAINGDSFDILPNLIEQSDNKILLYLDPPFDIRVGFDGIYEKLINLVLNFNKDKVKFIIFEHSSNFKFDKKIGQFSIIKTKKFGATALTYFS